MLNVRICKDNMVLLCVGGCFELNLVYVTAVNTVAYFKLSHSFQIIKVKFCIDWLIDWLINKTKQKKNVKNYQKIAVYNLWCLSRRKGVELSIRRFNKLEIMVKSNQLNAFTMRLEEKVFDHQRLGFCSMINLPQ